jgi:hypothetical protein
MRSISRRIHRLEERLGPPVETEYTRRLREWIEAGRRRLAEAQERGEWCGPVGDHHGENLAGLSVIEVLHRGRARVARAKDGSARVEAAKTQAATAAELKIRRQKIEAILKLRRSVID